MDLSGQVHIYREGSQPPDSREHRSSASRPDVDVSRPDVDGSRPDVDGSRSDVDACQERSAASAVQAGGAAALADVEWSRAATEAWYKDPSEGMAQGTEAADEFWYKDPSGVRHGPFDAATMDGWHQAGYFPFGEDYELLH